MKFNKTVTATDNDLIIKIDDSTSKDLVQIKQGDKMIMADSGSMTTGKSLQIRVAKGESATIEFPVKPQIML